MQGICLLGATGSIGQSTLEIIAQHPDKFNLVCASAHSSVDKMADICQRFKPNRVVMGTLEARDELARKCQGLDISFEWGEDALADIAADDDVDQVMAAIMGFAGLKPTLSGIRAKKRILLANKESLVTAGQLFMDEVAHHDVLLLPIDSEHNAIFQSLPQHAQGAHKKHVEKLLLTASGGPFRSWSLEEMRHVTPEQACKHPNWSMGQKISIDSASLMNKGLELIEACWLFGVTPAEVDVVVHPESIVHSMASYVDGTVIAQMGNPDMKIPIAYGMTWPERITTAVPALDLVSVAQLNFEAPDLERFPNLQLASDAWYAGGTAMATLNAANEVSVAAFLEKKIGFLDIATINRAVLNQLDRHAVTSLEVVFEADHLARQATANIINKKGWL
ncbi:1-deoxy-D-xylulose-5-phosphate reductoisomerase [Marinomonas pollencensis]|uniref:1-deoxy-D-xylulose 5-phosphate reductoisomerase n=1 Tax=Marinomonas pollencensis TaxID=491954 RepID=A0A3E0DVK5_9GAMM|nr:1-deoxy-D-xylulose-5-phosphate reductoisomerase [Marinomonas pollencensis]REG86885.1 1-deoxy-D-xylulose 5-phosphate reductoisomerase [Marinomonas pollencensis]